MSNDEALRRQTQEQIQQNPGLQKVESNQTGSAHDAQVINAEIQRQQDQQNQN